MGYINVKMCIIKWEFPLSLEIVTKLKRSLLIGNTLWLCYIYQLSLSVLICMNILYYILHFEFTLCQNMCNINNHISVFYVCYKKSLLNMSFISHPSVMVMWINNYLVQL